MFNIGGGELLVIAMLALIVLGPDKLPQAARQVGRFMSEARKISAGFRQEMKSALEEAEATTGAGAASATPAATTSAPTEDDLIEARARERGRQLAAAPEGAEPIGGEPVKAEPVEPPGSTTTPAARTKAPGGNGRHAGNGNGNGANPGPAAGDSTPDPPDPS